MKLIVAIVDLEDEEHATELLNQSGFFVTRLSTRGGWFKKTNSTLLIGTEDDKVEKALSILKESAGKKEFDVKMPLPSGKTSASLNQSIHAKSGGCTTFVLSLDKMVKL